jgi:hypothetical protein
MKLVRSKAFSGIIFIAFCLLLSYQFLLFAQQPETKCPAELQELLQGKSSDFTAAASQLKETNLPAALAVIELLKFKALHREIPVNVDQINDFEAIIESRLKNSSVVSFSRTETCRKKVEAKEIEIAGQKIAIPEYYTAEVGLSITGVIPTGEAGTIFPDVQVTFFSQSPLTAYSLTIDNKPVPPEKIGLFKENEESGLIFRPDLTADSILSIGTHTAEIAVANKAGEQITKKWNFTVGVYDTPTPPMPDGSKILKEISVEPEKFLSGNKYSGQIFVTVYQTKEGQRFTEYKLITSQGTIIRTRNLAFIARKIEGKKNADFKHTVLPVLTYAFKGNSITFSYKSSGAGKIIEEEWSVSTGGSVFSIPGVKILGDTTATCKLTVEHSYTDDEGETHTYQAEYSASRSISELTYETYLFGTRQFQISNQKPYEFKFGGHVYIWLFKKLKEGGVYHFDFGSSSNSHKATLTVDKLRWQLVAAEGKPEIQNVLATQTSILFSKHGFAEVAFDVEFTWQESGHTLKSSFKPKKSALFAFYPVTGNIKFQKYPLGQLPATRRRIEIKNFNIEIKGQKREIESESDCWFNQPIELCQSVVEPELSPLQIENAIPLISTKKLREKSLLKKESIFSFLSPMSPGPGEISLSFNCQFQPIDFSNASKISLRKATHIKDLQPIPVYASEDVLSLNLYPAEEQTILEGQEIEFELEVLPKPGFGEGALSKNETSLNILNGYKFQKIENIFWYEVPLWEEKTEDWKSCATKSSDFTHIFNPGFGVGSYSMMCMTMFSMEESDTEDTAGMMPSIGVPVTVKPGLRILTPVDKLAYPLNQTIYVKTTLDSEALWHDIKWKLNGKDFSPLDDKPEFPVDLSKTGKWSLEAELETEDPVTGEEIILRDKAEFEVIPLNISLIPHRKVINYSVQNFEQLRLIIDADGNEPENPGVPFNWQGDEIQAVVEPIEWSQIASPTESFVADFDPQSFMVDCSIQSPGATTVLATVTVRIIGAEKLFNEKHKGFDDEFEEPVFTFPVTRADLWAIQMSEITNIEKHFPEKSIARAYRTYQVKSFDFEFSSNAKNKHSFSNEEGLKPGISLSPALPGISPVTASIDFEWQVSPEDIISQNLVEPTKMVIKPSEPCDYKIEAQPILDFGSSRLKMGKITTIANAVDLFSLIETRVEPASFTITVGETKTLKYIVSSLEPNPPQPNPDPGNASGSVIASDDGSESNLIYLLNKSYALSIDRVEWSYELDSSTQRTSPKTSVVSNSYKFSSEVPGKVKGQAKGHLEVQELKSIKTVDFGAIANFSGNISAKPIQILINGKPLGSEKYHMGQKIALSYKAEPDNLENVIWSVENPLAYKSEMNTRSTTHTVKNYKVKVLNEEDLKQKRIEFYLYDFNPEKVIKNGSFTYYIDGKKYVKEFEISYERPIFTTKFILNPPGQKVDLGWDSYFKKWRIGFSDKDGIGIYAQGKLINNTEINYMFGAYQLIKVNGVRTFIKFKDNIATNPSIIQQYLKTVEKSDSLTTKSKFWLDTTAPQDDKDQRAIVFSQENSVIEIANDMPSITLDETIAKNGSEYYAGGCLIEEKFLVHVFAKPTKLTDFVSDNPNYYQSIWFPVAVFEWSWNGQVTYNLQRDMWEIIATATVNLNEKNIASFSSWPDVAIGDTNPKWRDF